MKPRCLIWLLALLLSAFEACAQVPAPAPASQQELDQMLAPIALYPDPLLSQILMAATYPLEVVEAAHWSVAHPQLSGEVAVAAVEAYGWDASVESLVAFPRILGMMEQKIEWTERLGDVFLAQQAKVMATIQDLRRRALAAGHLGSNERIVVKFEGPIIVIEPADPQLVYVPYYDPNVVYGTWWWADYPPVYWAPWPGYAWRPGYALGWGVGITVGSGFFFGAFDWARHWVDVRPRHTRVPQVWRHNPTHRRGVPYHRVPQRLDYRGYPAPQTAPRVQPEIRQTPRVRPEIRQTPRVRPEIRQTPRVRPETRQTPRVRPETRQTPRVRPEIRQTPRVRPEIRQTPRVQSGARQSRTRNVERERPAGVNRGAEVRGANRGGHAGERSGAPARSSDRAAPSDRSSESRSHGTGRDDRPDR